MAVRPVKFNEDGSIRVHHDEFEHGGTILETDIRFAKKQDGTDDERFIVLECPVAGCTSMSIHPVSGGCDAEKVQKLFALKLITSKGHPAVTNLVEAKAVLKPMVEAMDGPGRWRLEGVKSIKQTNRIGP